MGRTLTPQHTLTRTDEIHVLGRPCTLETWIGPNGAHTYRVLLAGDELAIEMSAWAAERVAQTVLARRLYVEQHGEPEPVEARALPAITPEEEARRAAHARAMLARIPTDPVEREKFLRALDDYADSLGAEGQ